MRPRSDSSERRSSPILVVDHERTGRRVRVAAAMLRVLVGHLPRYHGRGLATAGEILGTLCREEKIVLSITDGSRLRVRLNDAYWIRQFVFQEPYEPEVFLILSRIARDVRDVLFIDCGANCGYWSALCSGSPFNWRCVAVEPAPTMITQLEETAALNQGRFRVEHAAVWDTDGVDLPFFESARPAGSHLVVGSNSPAEVGAELTSAHTTTIDSIMLRHGIESELLIVKLDVEGAEIQALQGARRTLSARDVLLIYEDHGADRRCQVTQFVLDELQMQIVHPRADGTAAHIDSVSSAISLKTNPNLGYNFVAYSRDGAFAKMFSD